MTQALESSTSGCPHSADARCKRRDLVGADRASKFGIFAITFGISFALLYTVFERLNWPLFTYHPASGKWISGSRQRALARPCSGMAGSCSPPAAHSW